MVSTGQDYRDGFYDGFYEMVIVHWMITLPPSPVCRSISKIGCMSDHRAVSGEKIHWMRVFSQTAFVVLVGIGWTCSVPLGIVSEYNVTCAPEA